MVRLHVIKFFFFELFVTGCAVEGNDVISPHVRFFCAVLLAWKRRNDKPPDNNTTAIWERETSVLSNFLALFRFDSDAHAQ